MVDAVDDPGLATTLRYIEGREIATRVERCVTHDVEAFDWNCSRSPHPAVHRRDDRGPDRALLARITELHDENARLTAELAALRGEPGADQLPKQNGVHGPS